MPLRLYNTLTRRVEELVPSEPGVVKIYCCGPTVYDVPHAGRASEEYAGTVTVDLRSHVQTAHAGCRFALAWPDAGEVEVRSTMDVVVDGGEVEVRIDLEARDGAVTVARRAWAETFRSRSG